ncbi:MAG: hypothetical protein LC623_09700, partial [Halobacteriales archaeon]|nr:hypothetical protein [Halobacteriales archaeon]
DYTDGKGKYLGGVPFDTLGFKNDMIKCTVRRSANYTDTIQDFTAGGAGQTFDIIRNAAVVLPGSGTTYMAVCWQITYLNFSDPLNPTTNLAQAHDWKLIIDLNDLGAPASWLAALQLHYGGQQPGDNGIGATTALRGFYSDDAGYSKGATTGQNGPGPCPNGPPPVAVPSGEITIHNIADPAHPLGQPTVLAVPGGWSCFDTAASMVIHVGYHFGGNPNVSCAGPTGTTNLCLSTKAWGYGVTTGFMRVVSACGLLPNADTGFFIGAGKATSAGLSSFPWTCVITQPTGSTYIDWWAHCAVNR